MKKRIHLSLLKPLYMTAIITIIATLFAITASKPTPIFESNSAHPHMYYDGAGSYNYRSQLTPRQQEYYDILRKLTPADIGTPRVLRTQSSEESNNDSNSLQAVFDALRLDVPELFWLDITAPGLGLSPTAMSYTASTFPYYPSAAGSVTRLETLATAINSSGATRYDRIKNIHDSIASKLTYDYSFSQTSYDAFGALSTGKSVCEGYAKAFKLACDRAGIPCIVVSGTGTNTQGGTEAHAWNYVQMENGKWYAVDLTWNDQDQAGKIFYDYFLVGGDTVASNFGGKTFSQSHTASGKLIPSNQPATLPVLEKTAYNAADSSVNPTAPTAVQPVTPTAPAATRHGEQTLPNEVTTAYTSRQTEPDGTAMPNSSETEDASGSTVTDVDETVDTEVSDIPNAGAPPEPIAGATVSALVLALIFGGAVVVIGGVVGTILFIRFRKKTF